MPCVKPLHQPVNSYYESTITGLYIGSLFRSCCFFFAKLCLNQYIYSSSPLAFHLLFSLMHAYHVHVFLPLGCIWNTYRRPHLLNPWMEFVCVCARVCDLGYMQAWIYFVQPVYETPVEHAAALSALGALVSVGSYSVTIFHIIWPGM